MIYKTNHIMKEKYLTPECFILEMISNKVTCASVISESFTEEFETFNWNEL